MERTLATKLPYIVLVSEFGWFCMSEPDFLLPRASHMSRVTCTGVIRRCERYWDNFGMLQFTHGGWFPIAVACGIFLISAIWAWGQRHRQWFLQGNDKKPLFEFLRTDPPDADHLKYGFSENYTMIASFDANCSTYAPSLWLIQFDWKHLLQFKSLYSESTKHATIRSLIQLHCS